jgi:hypothetical protein
MGSKGGIPLITMKGNMMINKVNDLIDPDGWDEQRVDYCLWPADAIHVKRIPINMEMEDSWAWRLDQKGIFSVNSAYKLHRTLLEHGAWREHGAWSMAAVPLVQRRVLVGSSLNGRQSGRVHVH